jgi:molybdopterin molybdotransferase
VYKRCEEENILISIEEALKIVLKETLTLGMETVSILSSMGKVLAEDIYSKDNLPPFDKSAMDGYAIKSKDTEMCRSSIEANLKVVGVIRAGDFSKYELKSGEAMKIMTGAPVPKGADAVVQKEIVEVLGEEITISDFIDINNNILKVGEEIKVGELALPKGKLIRPAEIGLFASLGYSKVKVFKSPKVVLLTTGDELVDINEDLPPGKIRNCNEYSLSALIKVLDAEVISFGVIKDDEEVLLNKMKEAFKQGDIVISSGGVSVGDYDFVESNLKKLEADIKFTSVAVKPGKPVTFATYKNKLFFGLPGNPLSAINTFEQFVKPAIRKSMGKIQVIDEEFSVIAGDNFKFKKGRVNHVYVNIFKENGVYYANKIGSQGSNKLLTISKANGIIIVDRDTDYVKVGDAVNGRFIFK